MGSIDVAREFDGVLLVLLDENFDVIEIYEADRSGVLAVIAAPGSKARNERGALPITKFKAIGQLRWQCLCKNAAFGQHPENPSVTPRTQSGEL